MALNNINNNKQPAGLQPSFLCLMLAWQLASSYPWPQRGQAWQLTAWGGVMAFWAAVLASVQWLAVAVMWLHTKTAPCSWPAPPPPATAA